MRGIRSVKQAKGWYYWDTGVAVSRPQGDGRIQPDQPWLLLTSIRPAPLTLAKVPLAHCPSREQFTK